MRYEEVEPYPAMPPRRSMAPSWVAVGFGVGVSLPLAYLIPWWGLLGLLAYLPWAVIITRHLILSKRDHQKHMAAADAWGKRMRQHHLRGLS